MESQIAPPLRAFARQEKISPTRLYELIDAGEIESYLEGGRRRIVVASYQRYIERRVTETAGVKLPSSNPKVKAREAAAKEAPPRSAAPQKGSRRAAR